MKKSRLLGAFFALISMAFISTLSSISVAFQSPVPIPPAVWLFGSGLLGLIGMGRRSG